MKKILLSLIALCCLAPAAAFAGHPLATDAAETVAPKSFEAETCVEFLMDKDNGVSKNTFFLQESITIGIIPKVDAFVSIPFASYKVEELSRETGLNDFTLGAKYNFMNIDKIAIAAKPFIVIPIGDEKKGLGEGRTGFGLVAVASLEIDKHISVDANLSMKHQGVKGEGVNSDYNEFGCSLAGKFEATKELKVVAEFVTAKPDSEGSKWASFITAGAVYALKDNIDLDFGVRVGLTKDTTDDIGLLAGVNFKF